MITQGKWLVSSSTIVCDENARIIANCNPAGIPVLDVPYEDAIDNAALIAAAPELLFMLKEIDEIIACDGELTNAATQVVSDIKELIAKAERSE